MLSVWVRVWVWVSVSADFNLDQGTWVSTCCYVFVCGLLMLMSASYTFNFRSELKVIVLS